MGELEIRIDSQERLRDFTFARQNCHINQNNLSILPYIIDKKPSAIIKGQLKDFLPDTLQRSGPIMLLLENQYAALVLALSVYLGRQKPKAELFSLLSVGRDNGETVITGLVNLESDWQEIIGCRRCAGSTKRRSRD